MRYQLPSNQTTERSMHHRDREPETKGYGHRNTQHRRPFSASKESVELVIEIILNEKLFLTDKAIYHIIAHEKKPGYEFFRNKQKSVGYIRRRIRFDDWTNRELWASEYKS